MKKLPLLLLSILISYSAASQAGAMKCYTKNEVGEMSLGVMSVGEDFIFERTNKLDKTKPSILDFDELKIINADTGEFSSMTKESNNHFKSGKYHYLTNDRRSVVVEISFNLISDFEFVYSKILMCEPF